MTFHDVKKFHDNDFWSDSIISMDNYFDFWRCAWKTNQASTREIR